LQIVKLVIIGVGDRRPITLRRRIRLRRIRLRRIGLRRRVVLRQRLPARRSKADQ
jgi:hypothetical protein